jgi:hypothetical protein
VAEQLLVFQEGIGSMDLVSYLNGIVKINISHTEWDGLFFEKLIVSQSKSSEPEGPLLCSQVPA